MRVLICDDHPIVRKGLREILQEEGPAVTIGEAATAQDALDLARKQSWDAVMLDITMPGRSGLELLKQLREERPNVPVLVLSVHPADQYALRVLRAGASGYLTKESAPDELLTAVRHILRGGRYISPSVGETLAADLGRPADELHLSVKTVSTYRARVLEKLHLRTTAQLMRYAIKHGLVD